MRDMSVIQSFSYFFVYLIYTIYFSGPNVKFGEFLSGGK